MQSIPRPTLTFIQCVHRFFLGDEIEKQTEKKKASEGSLRWTSLSDRRILPLRQHRQKLLIAKAIRGGGGSDGGADGFVGGSSLGGCPLGDQRPSGDSLFGDEALVDKPKGNSQSSGGQFSGGWSSGDRVFGGQASGNRVPGNRISGDSWTPSPLVASAAPSVPEVPPVNSLNPIISKSVPVLRLSKEGSAVETTVSV